MPENSTITGKIGTELEFCGLHDLRLRSIYDQKGWTFSGRTVKGDEVSIRELWNELVPAVPLPFDMDLRLRDINLEIFIGKGTDNSSRDYTLSLEAAVTVDFNPSDDFQSQLNIDRISFIYQKKQSDERETSVTLNLEGNANVNDEIIVTDCSLDFEYKYNAENQQAEWSIGGELYLLAFQRLMAFKAEVSSLKDEQQIGFSFSSTEPILHTGYFNRVNGAAAADIMKALNGGISPVNGQILVSALPADVSDTLGNTFTPEQKDAVNNIVGRAKKSNDPLITIPDLLNDNKPLCTISPRLFSLKLTRENKRFKSIDFAIGADLTVYNTLLDQTELFSLKNGLVSSGFDRDKKRFYLSFTADQAIIKPFSAIAILPGILDMLMSAFGENAGYYPKTSAFVNMLEIQPKNILFIKQDKDWQLAGGVRLVLNDGLRTVDNDLYNFIERLFPKSGDVRYIEGGISYDSKEGLYFVLENNNGIEIPNFLKMAADAIDPQFKADFKQKTAVDLDQALDLGTSFVILERVRIKIAKQAEMDMRIGIGLPSNLNDRLFNPSSKIHGLINTYNREKFEKARQSQASGQLEYNPPLPDDNLIRAELSISTEGISGQLIQFNVFNFDKIAEEFKGFITEQGEHLTVDLNALTNGGTQYGRLRFEKFRFKLDFKTCAFTIGGGVELLSDTLRIPVRQLAKKLIAILPTDKFDVSALNALAERLIDYISIHSINFYDPASGRLQLDDLLGFLKQFLLAEQQQIEIIPPALLDFLREHSHQITKHLPDLLLQYFSLKVPSGLKFQVEVTADQSLSFAVEVPEPTEAQRAAGYADCLQVLVPDFSIPPMFLQGIRLKKIGLGSGLFNQAIRLDLSAELTAFRYTDLLAGAGLSLVRDSMPDDYKVQHIVPNVKSFGFNYKIENLLMLIFPQTVVPIPVPVFYDKFSAYAAGLEGSREEVAIRFPRPKVNIKEAFGILGELVKFFKDTDFALPVASYGEVRQTEEVHQDSIMPTFYAGPAYIELPGIIGYQKFPDGSRKHIMLGFKDLKVLNPSDLAALVANTTKFAIRSVAEKQRYRIRIDYNRAEYPVNYLVKFLPETQRIGTKELVLFDIFDVSFAWALSTPGEFKEKVFPLLLQEQLKSGRPGYNDNWTANELLNMIPAADKWNSEQDGVVIFLKGSINISDQFIIDAVTASAITSSDGVSTGISIRSRLANIFDMELAGGIRVDVMSSDNKFGLSGKASLVILGRVPVLKGAFTMGVGSQSHFRFNGMLDLFPDELFGGSRSSIQFYTGTQRGTKADITGVIDRNGINIGHFNPNGSITHAGLHLEIGAFYLGGTTRIVTTSDRQEWELRLACYNTELTLYAGLYAIENGNELQFAWSANSPIGIENLFWISGTEPGTGASGRLMLTYRGQSLIPEFTECYLDGAVSLFGLSSTTRLHIRQDGFLIDSNANLGILYTRLKVSGANFNDISGFAFSGHITLINEVCRFQVDAAYYRLEDRALFKGSGYMEFWGERRMDIQVEVGTDAGMPSFNAEGVLDLSLPGGAVTLYSGSRDGKSSIRGNINKDRLEMTGGLFFQVGELQAGGNFEMRVDGGGEFRAFFNMSFQAGILSGGNIGSRLVKNGHLLFISGASSGNIVLIPGIFELSASSSLDFWMNQVTNELGKFQLTGTCSLLGTTTWYDLQLSQNSFAFSCNVYLPLLDMSISARSGNLSSVEHLRLSGKIDIGKLNAEIDKFYEAIGIRGKVNDKANAALNGMWRLQGSQNDMRYRQERVEFIRWMDSVWNGNGIDPDGYQFCVPPDYHVDYWSDSRWNWDWGRPRYSKQDLENVRRYYQYKRELGMNADFPPRHDIGRFVNGILQALNNVAYEVATNATNVFRQVINDIHNVLSNEILRNLNIDTTDINWLNHNFNEGINILNNEAAKWRDFNNRLLNYKPLEINEITYTDQSINLLQSKAFVARVTFTILGEQRTVEQVFDINDPVGCLVRNAKQFLPAELAALI
jgi:hypothetical protein